MPIDQRTNVVIARRFCGPPNSGNGGYSCGIVAGGLAHPVEVTLLAPPPLDVPLVLECGAGGNRLLESGRELAFAKAAPLDLVPPQCPTLEEAAKAAENYVTAEDHLVPGCFVCGPLRLKGEALRIFAGQHASRDVAAAPWIPEAQYCDADGLARPEIIWAALDCPGYFGLRQKGLVALLGQLTADIFERPSAGEQCIAVGWRIANEGRKYIAGTALYGADGRLLAQAKAIWIELDRQKFAAATAA